jgi:hypothetical protein
VIVAMTMTMGALTDALSPDQRREVAARLRSFDGDESEREFYDRIAGGLERYADDAEREAA